MNKARCCLLIAGINEGKILLVYSYVVLMCVVHMITLIHMLWVIVVMHNNTAFLHVDMYLIADVVAHNYNSVHWGTVQQQASHKMCQFQ